jgi:hypothetical protein
MQNHFPSNISLIESIATGQTVLQKSEPSSRAEYMYKHCQDLGLLLPYQVPSTRHAWGIHCNRIENLDKLPDKLLHAGDYDWVGEQDQRPPTWLWDSVESCTVATDDTVLRDGYIAVSYTWGRWKCGERMQPGTTWSVPIVDCGFDLRNLMSIMTRVPGCRYFWVDVLCINQADGAERQEEISKQGSIFAQAKGVLAYLWNVESGKELVPALDDIGNLVLWSARLSNIEDREKSRGIQYDPNYIPENHRTTADTLLSDPWFSSLWTLQEMILFPASLWVTRQGEFCTVNEKLVTTAFIASACALIAEFAMSRQAVLNLLKQRGIVFFQLKLIL